MSPHAPYTVSGRLFAAAAVLAREEGLPIAVHVAESPAESELLASGSGGFARAWRDRGIPMPSPLGFTPVEWLDCHGVLSDRTLCIDLVQVSPPDIGLLVRADASVAHCPLSNRAHRHGVADLRSLLLAGLRVGVGTDSVVSVGTLDLLSEARAAAALADLDANGALALCTISAARALGMDGEVGSLRAGKWGDCTVIRPLPSSAGLEPAARVLDKRSEGCRRHLCGRKGRASSRADGMKIQRHAVILRVVRDRRIESQDELREALAAEGVVVTQATLSRDIRELGLPSSPTRRAGHTTPTPIGRRSVPIWHRFCLRSS